MVNQIEVFFSGSACGTYHTSRLKKQECPAVYFESFLDMGQIDCDYDAEYRKNLYNEIYAATNPELNQPGEGMDEFFEKNAENLKGLLLLASKGTKLRIWIDHNPEGMCEFVHLCSELVKLKSVGEIYVLEHPSYVPKKDYAQFVHGWGILTKKEMEIASANTRFLSKIELIEYANEWERVKQENTLLRTIINGKIISVDEDFYDTFILRYIKEEPISIGHLVGDYIEDTCFKVTSQYAFWRVNVLIEKGVLEVVKEANPGERISTRIIRKTP